MYRRRLTQEEQAYAKQWLERRRESAIAEFRVLGRLLAAVAAVLYVLALVLL